MKSCNYHKIIFCLQNLLVSKFLLYCEQHIITSVKDFFTNKVLQIKKGVAINIPYISYANWIWYIGKNDFENLSHR